jgi:hypothetical protein
MILLISIEAISREIEIQKAGVVLPLFAGRGFEWTRRKSR